MAGAPIVVGHSLGGYVTMASAANHPKRFAGAIVLDSAVTAPDPDMETSR